MTQACCGRTMISILQIYSTRQPQICLNKHITNDNIHHHNENNNDMEFGTN